MELCKDVVEWHLPLGHEKELIGYVKEHLPPDMDVFVDIGANVGTWALNLSDKFKHIYAFEPFAASRKALDENVRMNHLSNITTFSCAMSDHIGTATLTHYVTGGHATLLKEHPIRHDVGEYAGSISVNTVTLDYIFVEFAPVPLKIDMIKIDTEGSELNIIRGGLEIIRKHNPILVIEIHDKSHIDAIFDLLPERVFEKREWGGQTYLLSW